MAKKIIDYKIINDNFKFTMFDDSPVKAEDLVKSEIKNGWVPQGGICVIEGSPGHYRFSQAMVKYEN